jgi:hypothetical protein
MKRRLRPWGESLELLRGDLRDHYLSPAYTAVVTRRWLVQSLVARGSFGEATPLSKEGVEIARALDHPFSLVNIHSAVGFLAARQGDFRATPLLEQSLELSRTLHFPPFVMTLTGLLALIYAHVGRHAEALVLIERTRPDTPQLALQMGEAYLLVGRATEASECATPALTLARERKERGHEAWALRLLGEIASHADSPDVGRWSDLFSVVPQTTRSRGMATCLRWRVHARGVWAVGDASGC